MAFGSVVSQAVEDAGTAAITLTLSKAATKDASIAFVLGGDAVEGTDFELVSGNPLFIAEGSAAATIEFTVADDAVINSARTILVTLTEASGVDLGDQREHSLSIVDDEYLISFPTADPTQVADGSGPLTLSVLFSAKQDVDLEIPVTITGVALDGVDFTAPAGPLVMVAGEEFALLELDILASPNVWPGVRSFEIEIGLPAGAVLGPNVIHEVEIANSLVPFVEIEPNNDAPGAMALGLIAELKLISAGQLVGSVDPTHDEWGTPIDPFDVFYFKAEEALHGSFTLTPDAMDANVIIALAEPDGTVLAWVDESGIGADAAETAEFDFEAGQEFLIMAHSGTTLTSYTIDGVCSAPEILPLTSSGGDSTPTFSGLGYYEWLRLHDSGTFGSELLSRSKLHYFDGDGKELGNMELRVEQR